jgi:hypothetical protein
VFRILPESTGSGRFLENLPADEVPMYLVFDKLDDGLGPRLQAALDDAGSPEYAIAVDTGGDALYRTTVADAVRSTPDQDLRVLKQLPQLNCKVYSIELAVGVDSPSYAADVLKDADAKYITFSDLGTQVITVTSIIARYKKWNMKAGGWLGKTPLAWSAALNGNVGLTVLDIPTSRVLGSNPWNPFVYTDRVMAGGFIMDVEKHLLAIGVE